jgi:TonB-dependent starch-binding outer membrane protein SusC
MKMKLINLFSKEFLLFCGFLLLLGVDVRAQEITVRGTVTASENQGPLPGVNILEKGTMNGTMTDFDGEFSMDVSSANAILVFSYMGFQTQEVALNGRTNVAVTLQVDAKCSGRSRSSWIWYCQKIRSNRFCSYYIRS